MSHIYGIARNGFFTEVRCSEQQLRMAGVIDSFTAKGLDIYAMRDTSRTARPVSAEEMETKVESIDDLQKEIMFRDVGVAGGVAQLNQHGEVDLSHMNDEIVTYLGEWNAQANDPVLIDGTGNTGDHYLVANAGTDLEVNFGSGKLLVSDGDTLMYRDGKYAVDRNGQIDPKHIDTIRNAKQELVDYQVVPEASEVSVAKGSRIYLQLSSRGVTRPEYFLHSAGGLSSVEIHPSSGAVTIDATDQSPGEYLIDVRVGGPNGYSPRNDIIVNVIEE